MNASLVMASLVLTLSESSTTFFDGLKYLAAIIAFLSALVSAASLVILLRYRVGVIETTNQRIDDKVAKLKIEVEAGFLDATKNLAKATSDIQLIATNQNVIQQLTTKTLESLLLRIEDNTKWVNDHTTMLAVINKELQYITSTLRDMRTHDLKGL